MPARHVIVNQFVISGVCSHFLKMGFVSERAVQCDTKIGRPRLLSCFSRFPFRMTSARPVPVRICPLNGDWLFEYKSWMTSHMSLRKCNEIILLLENNKMLHCKIKMQKKTAEFFSICLRRERRPLACQPALLTIRLHASPGIATFKTACDSNSSNTIAQVVTRGRHCRRNGN